MIRVELHELEIARGTDGFLRGAPEPVIVAGVFAERADAIALVGRIAVRFATPKEIPSTVAASESELRIEHEVQDGDRFFALLCAIEEDSGSGVRQIYESLADPSSIFGWKKESGVPEPAPIRCPDAIQAIELVGEISGDDWVAAALVPIPRPRTTLRVRFESRGNDWIAVLSVKG